MTFIHTTKEEKKKKREQSRLSQTLSRSSKVSHTLSGSSKVSHTKQKSVLKSVIYTEETRKNSWPSKLSHTHTVRGALILIHIDIY